MEEGNKPHKKLDAWKKAIELTVQIYKLTHELPTDEKFGLVSQMRRAAVSIASNIAEGAARRSNKEFTHFPHSVHDSPFTVHCSLFTDWKT
jgi:four helix bundle protein